MRGNLRKMAHSIDDNGLVHYQARLVSEKYLEASENTEQNYTATLDLDNYLGKKISLKFLEQINCINCGQKTKTSFNQGYCYRCFTKLAECDICILKPELCHFDKGTCRDEEFAKEHCNINHSLYLSVTSDLKIGITREQQELKRWVDQGAIAAIRLLTAKRRYHIGLLENSIAKNLPDKTNWRNMLKNNYPTINLKQEAKNLQEKISSLITELSVIEDLNYISESISNNEPYFFKYPVLKYPQKINSHNLEKEPLLEGTLLGIKGQYLILDTKVINLRKYTGYLVEVN